MDDKEVKKSTGLYQDFAHSKQTFPNVRFFEAINGNVVLRGKDGARDRIYPLPKACKRFWAMMDAYSFWKLNGFTTQCEELKLVLYELGRKIQQAVAQRLSGKAQPPPAFADAKYMAKLQEALNSL